jgi:hypothetical protein
VKIPEHILRKRNWRGELTKDMGRVKKAPKSKARIISFLEGNFDNSLTRIKAEIASEKAEKETMTPEMKPRLSLISDNNST